MRALSIAGETHWLSWQSGSNGGFKSIAIYDPSLAVGYAIVTSGDSLAAIQAGEIVGLTSDSGLYLKK